MSDILLIQPPIHDFYFTAKRTLPYGLACIAGVLRRDGFKAAIVDALATAKSKALDWPAELDYLKPYFGRDDRSPFALFHRFRHFGYSYEHLVKQAKASGANLIGISSLFSAYSDSALETAARIRQALPQARIVMGGHHPTALPEAVMQHPCVDYVVRGDGEAGLPPLAAALGRGASPEGTPGLVRRGRDGRLVVAPPAVVRDLEALPPPAFDLVDTSFYARRGESAVTLSATRGCPLRCTYCAVNAGTWHGYRRRSVAAVMRDLDAAGGQPVGFIDFEDENLNADKAWFHDLLTALELRFPGPRPELRAMNGLYAPSLDDRTVAHMKRAGFRTLNL
ncbi:MAG: cobalamin-dependent protein, partial [Desulfosarcinaceae bacterium]